jgi:2-C-methyl-D-erythritol 2,4-cyclodiphosphate synthase
MDALLGAAALGDIGRHFPDSDPAYEGISSIELLKKVKAMLEGRLYFIENIDATIVAQKPKLAGYIPMMVKNIAAALEIEEDRVNVKATTEEGLGFTGAELGIAANAVCLIEAMMNYQVDVTPKRRAEIGCDGCSGCSKI